MSGDPGTLQMTAGLHVQLRAIEQREAAGALEEGAANPELAARQATLKSALAQVNEFENQRDALIAADKARFKLPLSLIWQATALLALIYCFACLLAKVAHVRRQAWSIPHSPLARHVLIAGNILLLLLLFTATVLQQFKPGSSQLNDAASYKTIAGFGIVAIGWWTVLGVMLAFGPVYPALGLPRVHTVLRSRGIAPEAQEATELRRQAAQAWRTAYCCLLRRYCGLLLGVFLCALSFWVIVYRILFSLYPWQVELLTTGLGQDEIRVIRQVMAVVGFGA